MFLTILWKEIVFKRCFCFCYICFKLLIKVLLQIELQLKDLVDLSSISTQKDDIFFQYLENIKCSDETIQVDLGIQFQIWKPTSENFFFFLVFIYFTSTPSFNAFGPVFGKKWFERCKFQYRIPWKIWITASLLLEMLRNLRRTWRRGSIRLEIFWGGKTLMQSNTEMFPHKLKKCIPPNSLRHFQFNYCN